MARKPKRLFISIPSYLGSLHDRDYIPNSFCFSPPFLPEYGRAMYDLIDRVRVELSSKILARSRMRRVTDRAAENYQRIFRLLQSDHRVAAELQQRPDAFGDLLVAGQQLSEVP